MLRWPDKSPTDTLDYGVDWSRELNDGEAIASGNFVVTAGGIAAGGFSIAGAQTVIFLSGGDLGDCCRLDATIVTSEGRTFTQCIEIGITACGGSTIATTTKRTAVAMAMEDCGLPGWEFSATPEEISSAVRRMDAMVRSWPFADRIGYNFPITLGQSDPDDPMGVDDRDVIAIVGKLAQAYAPGLGKTLSPEQKAVTATAYSVMLGRAPVPQAQMPANTPRGAGNRWAALWRPYFGPRYVQSNCCGL